MLKDLEIEFIFTMHCVGYLLLIEVFLNNCMHNVTSVKVNVEGTLSVGRDVVGSLSQLLGSTFNSGRRLMPLSDEDPITEIIRTAAVCHDLEFSSNLRQFIEEYITVLAMSLHRIFEELRKSSFDTFLFCENLQDFMEVVREVLKRTSNEINGDAKVYYWIQTLKIICQKFQEMASNFINEVNSKETKEIIDEVQRRIIVGTVIVETKYQTKLCVDSKICIKSYEVTKSVNDLLEQFNTTSEDKAKQFVRYVHEALFDTAFYSHFSERVAHEMQVILNDMAYSNGTLLKESILIAQKTVQARLKLIKMNGANIWSVDRVLINGILSDMDHIYSVHKLNPFSEFLQHFYAWLHNDSKLDKEIRKVVLDIGKELNGVPKDMFRKLMSEVKVFLEMAVGPENNT